MNEYREAYSLCEMDGVPVSELADDLGVSKKTIRSRIHVYKCILSNKPVKRLSIYCRLHLTDRPTKKPVVTVQKKKPHKVVRDDGSAWVKFMTDEVRECMQ
jgi:transcriptional antiterminator